MHHTVWSRDQLSVVAEETASREARAGIECNVAHRNLNREGLSSVCRFRDEVLYLRIKRIVPAVVPTDVHSSRRRCGRPREEVLFQVVEGITVDADHLRRSGLYRDAREIHAR